MSEKRKHRIKVYGIKYKGKFIPDSVIKTKHRYWRIGKKHGKLHSA
jgi:hypothetical protein